MRGNECGGGAILNGGQVVEGFVGEGEFKVYAMCDRVAVEVLADEINVVMEVGLVKQAGCRALCILDFTKGFGKVRVWIR